MGKKPQHITGAELQTKELIFNYKLTSLKALQSANDSAFHLSKREAEIRSIDDFEGNDELEDRYCLIYLVFVLLGVGILLPWNMFITLKDYFIDFKLSTKYAKVHSDYATNFLPYVALASCYPNLILNLVNIFIPRRQGMIWRILLALLVMIAAFIVSTVLVMMDTSKIAEIFFWSTIALVVVLNMASGIFQSSVFGLAAEFPLHYTGAVFLGMNLCATLTSAVNVLSIYFNPNLRIAAVYCFIFALFILLVCTDGVLSLPLNNFYHRCVNSDAAHLQKESSRSHPPYCGILKGIFPQVLNIFAVAFVSFSLFPSVVANVLPARSDFFIPAKYYSAVLCYFTFSLFSLLGNFAACFVLWPKPRWIWMPITLRFVFIPLLLLCEYHPAEVKRIMPVVVSSDWVYWSLSALLGLSNGYFLSLALMYCPMYVFGFVQPVWLTFASRNVVREHSSVASTIGITALVAGVIAGVHFSLALNYLVQQFTW